MSDALQPRDPPWPPQWHINEALDERGWTSRDLANHTGLGVWTCHYLTQGETRIDARIAQALAKAIGGDAKLWLYIESKWQLHKLTQSEVNRDA